MDVQQLRNPIFILLYTLIQKYPTPANLSYLWNFGIFAFIALMIQIITGIFLVMHYTPEINMAFLSIEHLMREVQLGWFKI